MKTTMVFKEIEVTKIDSGNPGKTITILSGVHGNEKTGVHIIEYLKKHLTIDTGVVFLVIANRRALQKNKRYINVNLNRSILKNIKVNGYEGILARELMGILDQSDALLDLHAYSQEDENAPCFAVCEENCFPIINDMNLPFSISSIHKFMRGSTDQYMFFSQKIGLCIELGSLYHPEKYFDKGLSYVNTFLSYFGNIHKKTITIKQNTTVHLDAIEFYEKQYDDFNFTRTLKSFDTIKAGEIFARENNKNFIAEKDSYIIFPNDNHPIGYNVYILATKRES